jgi:RimJ/RimL family protein N-acetyltransferase
MPHLLVERHIVGVISRTLDIRILLVNGDRSGRMARILPDRIDLPDAHLRPLRVDDADAVAVAVRESLEHLRPWMPWADNGSADPAFQRQRLTTLGDSWARGEEYQYGLFEPDDTRVIGSFGLMSRRGRGTLEIGYWVHVDACGRGHATRATAALTDVALTVPDVHEVFIVCDVDNARSAAIPARLGYELVGIVEAEAKAPSESGRQQVWRRRSPIGEPVQ